ncbi:MAG: dolichyl-phosphate mannose synthase-like protein [Candidatus Gottesmanbacteria bacterium GW2011_GWA2_43_14]|uniref:Dolichyl-phosphate mannose synthase-like protein n=1 Tax=Candidatus Gottesmanbacteria bacterium GW2011_GWA2_43_14 TaxID=1618443 RepID=A0A0G1FUF4_9BACT|nr:MAG: dolichyl-phosphate mannose synthase-like protein [Candidatus Gottesmanbacteria bacterium GW2011_GWA2_43_14]
MMNLSIIVPVFNERKTITPVLHKLLHLKLPVTTEIVVVDDGSTDGTAGILKKWPGKDKEKKKLKIVFHRKNSGKGEAVKTGIKEASGDYILVQDADFEYNPSEIGKLLAPLVKQKNNGVFAVYGSRFMSGRAVIPKAYLFGNKILTFFTNITYGVHLTDMETGYKLLPAKIVKNLSLKAAHFDFEPEITGKIIRKKVKIIEVPISYRGRDRLAGKKLTVIDAFEAIKAIFYYRFFD